MPPKIIGLYSPAPQSGKSIVARQLVLEHGYRLRPFAGPLRAMLTTMLQGLGLSDHQISHYLHQDKATPIPGLGISARRLMQTLGTDWGRQMVADDLWVNAWTASVFDQPLVVADDVRFPNEAHAIKLKGGEVWKIWRPGQRDSTGHVSEGLLNTWDSFDRLIVNDGDLAQLSKDVAFELR